MHTVISHDELENQDNHLGYSLLVTLKAGTVEIYLITFNEWFYILNILLWKMFGLLELQFL